MAADELLEMLDHAQTLFEPSPLAVPVRELEGATQFALFDAEGREILRRRISPRLDGASPGNLVTFTVEIQVV